MPKNQRVIGTLFVFLSSTGFAIVPTFTKKLYAYDTNAMGVMTVRFTLAAILMFAIRAFMVRNTPWPSGQTISAAIAVGSLNNMGISLTYFIAINDIDTGLAIVLFYANPLFIVLGSWLISKKRPSTQYRSLYGLHTHWSLYHCWTDRRCKQRRSCARSSFGVLFYDLSAGHVLLA